MSRFELMIENLATELIESGSWAWQGYTGWGRRGYYHFRHPYYICKICVKASSECSGLPRIKSLLKCELRRRYNNIKYITEVDRWGQKSTYRIDPNSFRGIVRQYFKRNDSTQRRLA